MKNVHLSCITAVCMNKIFALFFNFSLFHSLFHSMELLVFCIILLIFINIYKWQQQYNSSSNNNNKKKKSVYLIYNRKPHKSVSICSYFSLVFYFYFSLFSFSFFFSFFKIFIYFFFT